MEQTNLLRGSGKQWLTALGIQYVGRGLGKGDDQTVHISILCLKLHLIYQKAVTTVNTIEKTDSGNTMTSYVAFDIYSPEYLHSMCKDTNKRAQKQTKNAVFRFDFVEREYL